MKFLITNSVPLNGGDEALLRALIISLTERWPDSEIVVLCSDVDRCRQYIPDIHFESDLEFTKTKDSRRNTIECYRKADIVLSAPGGFLHDFYPLEQRLRGFELALKLSKPVVLVGQSIGPFFRPKSMKRIRKVLNRVSGIYVRDEISRDHLLGCGVNASNIIVTGDIAFLWRKISPKLNGQKAKTSTKNVIGLSFRGWPCGDEHALHEIIAKAARFCQYLLEDEHNRLLFLSTCQGISGYVDDSQIASTIKEMLPEHLRLRCEVNSLRYRPQELMCALGQCDAFIGMRLHACIFAMLAGVPAMGIGYEDKTSQIFRQMGLDAYQTRFDFNVEKWIEHAERFFAHRDEIVEHLPYALDARCAVAAKNIEALEVQLSKLPHPQISPESRWTQSVVRYGQPHLRLRQVAALVNELTPKRMLDVGCATGILRTLCPGVEYVGCDFVQASAQADFPFYQCNLNREPLPSILNDFDVIVCSGILEYVEDLPTLLSTLRSRLRLQGHLVFTYLNMNHISRILELVRGKSFPVHCDWRGFYSPKDTKRIVEDAGFRIVRSVAMNHTLLRASAVENTVSSPLTLPKARWWSNLLSHQHLFVAARSD
jgi:polysaccharide pyruvyl transferase WcaK-like protein/2-polyprenyl-3-methyl-5-hydroxy-6-metoxy-1,4-benzoquinol methylase